MTISKQENYRVKYDKKKLTIKQNVFVSSTGNSDEFNLIPRGGAQVTPDDEGGGGPIPIDELEQAVGKGITLNANSGQELERVSRYPIRGRVGLRCNPVVAGAGRASATMVAMAGSKFGVTLDEARSLLTKHTFVSGLHHAEITPGVQF